MATNIQYPVSGSYQINIKAEDQCGNLTEEVRVISVRDKYYTISYDSKGGSAFSPDRVIEEGSITSFPLPTKDGYAFGGWFDNEFCYGDPLTEIDPVTKDYILYAKWDNAGYGTFIFNSPTNVKTLGINIPLSRLNEYTAQYGSVIETYPALSEDNPYIFVNPNDRYWASYRSAIQTVVIGSELRPYNMDWWFDGMTAVTSIINASYIIARSITSMKGTFRDCQSLRNIDLSTWRTDSLTILQSAFQGCLHYDNWAKDFQTGLIDDFSYCFASTGVQNEGETPQGLLMQNYIDLQSWDFSSATTLAGMFAYSDCDEIYLPTVGISQFSLPAVTSVNSMFSWSEAVRIYSKDFVFGIPSVTSERMFYNADDVIGAQGTPYTVTYIDKYYARVDNVFADSPGYFRGEVECTLTFNVNGGIPLSPKLCKGGEVYTLPTTTKTGKKLEGWYIDPDFLLKAGTGFSYRVPFSRTLYAKWVDPEPEGTHYLFYDGTLVLGLPDSDVEAKKHLHGDIVQIFTNDASATESIFTDNMEYIRSVYCGSEKTLLEPTAGAFKNAVNLTGANLNNLILNPATQPTPTQPGTPFDFTSLFEGCEMLSSVDMAIDGSVYPTGYTSSMFKGCKILTSLVLPTAPQTMGVGLYSCDHMFDGCKVLGPRIDLTGFDFSNAHIMNHMFYHAEAVKEIEFASDIDTSNALRMEYMFAYCRQLERILGLEKFDTKNATHITGIFANSSSLVELNCSGFDTTNTVSVSGLFDGCTKLKTVYANEEFIYRDGMISTLNLFSSCNNLVGGNGTTYNYTMADDGNFLWIDGRDGRQGLLTQSYGLGTAYAVYNSTTKTISFFRDAPNKYTHRQVIGDKTYFKFIETTTDWTDFWTSDIKSNCEYVEAGNQVEFYIAGAKSMFNGFTAVKGIDLRQMNFSGTDMSNMFKNCGSLRDIWFSTRWDTNNVKIMAYVFGGCSALRTADLATAMQTWRVEEVQNCTGMFDSCSSLTAIDLTNFDFGSTVDTSYMFNGCTHVSTITVGASKSFALDYITTSGMMFGSCNALVGQNGTRFSSSYTGKSRAVIDLPSQPGYLTAG